MHHGDAVSPISAHSPKANGFTRFSTAALLFRARTSLQCLIQPHRLHVQGGIVHQELQTCRTHLQNFWGLGMAIGMALGLSADQMRCAPAHPSAFGWEATIHCLQQPDIGDILQRHFRYQRALIGGAMVIGQHRHVEVHLKAPGELQARDHVLPTPISTIQCVYIYIYNYIYIYVCKYRQDNIITLCMWISSFTNSVSYDFLCLYTCAYGHTYVDTVYVLGSPPSLRYFGCYALGGPPTALGRRRGRSRTAGPAGPWSRFWLHVTHIDILMRCIMYNVYIYIYIPLSLSCRYYIYIYLVGGFNPSEKY